MLIAAILTATIVVALTLYACTTDTDFTFCGGFLFMAAIGFVVASILNIFIKSHFLKIALSFLGALLFGIYLIFDTQIIMGKFGSSLSIDDYIMGAMMLYIDIIQLFIQILKILSEFK